MLGNLHHVLSQCDQVIIFEDGKIKVSGSYQEILSSGIDIQKYLPEKNEEEEDGEITGRKKTLSFAEKDTERRKSTAKDEEELEKKGSELMTKEEMGVGDVTMDTYWGLIKYGGLGIFAFVICGQLSSQVLNINGTKL